jgi:hypothetical protein
MVSMRNMARGFLGVFFIGSKIYLVESLWSRVLAAWARPAVRPWREDAVWRDNHTEPEFGLAMSVTHQNSNCV